MTPGPLAALSGPGPLAGRSPRAGASPRPSHSDPRAAGARDRPGPVSRAARGSLPPAARPSSEAEGPGPGRDGTGRDGTGGPGRPVTGVRRGRPEAAGVSPSRSPAPRECATARRAAPRAPGGGLPCSGRPLLGGQTAPGRERNSEDPSSHQILPLHDLGLMTSLAQTLISSVPTGNHRQCQCTVVNGYIPLGSSLLSYNSVQNPCGFFSYSWASESTKLTHLSLAV